MTVAPAMSNWSKGELSPQLRGRVDTQHYYNSAESLKNCMVRPYGNVINRAGSHYIGEAKGPIEGSEGSIAETIRLLKFVFSVSESYIIEMGQYYFRFYNKHQLIQSTPFFDNTNDAVFIDTNGNKLTILLRGLFFGLCLVEAESAYFTAEMVATPHFIRIRVNGEVKGEFGITIIEGEGSSVTRAWGLLTIPFEVQGVVAGGNWGVSDVYYDPEIGEYGPVEVVHTYTQGELKDVHYVQKDDVMYLAHKNHPPARLIRSSDIAWTLEDMVFKGGPFKDDNSDESWTVNPDGAVVDTNIVVVASQATWVAGDVGKIFKINGFNDDGEQGYIIITAFNSTTNINGDVKIGLDSDDATAVWAYAEWGEEDGVKNYPSTVSFHESRLFWGGSPLNPQKLWGSKTYLYDDHSAGSEDDGAINIALASAQANHVQWLSSGNNLASGTFGEMFIVTSGSGGTALKPSNVHAKNQSGYGSEKLQPKKMGSFVYYLQRGFRKIREFYYFWDQDNYKTIDMTKYSEHVTLSGIKEIDYQQNPDSVLWCVLNNGKIAIMTRDAEEEILAWCPVETEGEYESVAVIPSPEGEFDEVWVVVNRVINGVDKKYIEYFGNHVVEEETSQTSLFYVDSGQVYDAFEQTQDIVLLVQSISETEFALTSSVAFFTQSSVGKRVLCVNSEREIVGEMEILRISSDVQVIGKELVEFTEFLFQGGDWGMSFINIPNLQHLAKSEVAILSDGGVRANELRKEVNSSGVLTLDSDAYFAVVGLPYQSVLRTNPIEAGAKNGTAQGKLKRIVEYALKVYRTLGIEVGDQVFNADPSGQRQVSTPLNSPEPLITGELANLQFEGDWDYPGQVSIVQNNPLPMNVLGIYPKLETSDKM